MAALRSKGFSLKHLSLLIIWVMVLAGALHEEICAQSNSGSKKSEPTVSEPILSVNPCGDPPFESQKWRSIQGKIEAVEDNRALLLVLPKGNRRIHVRLAGISLDRNNISSDQAKAELEELGLHKGVEVLVNPKTWDQDTSKRVVGIVLLKEHRGKDLGLTLLSEGLAHTEEPAPYAMSSYTFCQYRYTEKLAQQK